MSSDTSAPENPDDSDASIDGTMAGRGLPAGEGSEQVTGEDPEETENETPKRKFGGGIFMRVVVAAMAVMFLAGLVALFILPQ